MNIDIFLIAIKNTDEIALHFHALNPTSSNVVRTLQASISFKLHHNSQPKKRIVIRNTGA